METHRFELLLLAALYVGAQHLARRIDVVEAPAHGGAGSRMLLGNRVRVHPDKQDSETIWNVVECKSSGRFAFGR
jgi:hypothetical protein